MTPKTLDGLIEYYRKRGVTLHCPICRKGTGIIGMTIAQTDGGDIVTFEMECMTCSDHLYSEVQLPYPLVPDNPDPKEVLDTIWDVVTDGLAEPKERLEAVIEILRPGTFPKKVSFQERAIAARDFIQSDLDDILSEGNDKPALIQGLQYVIERLNDEIQENAV